MPIRPTTTLIAVGVLLLSACGGSTTGSASDSSTTTDVRPVSSLEGVREAVVRIDVEGTFEYPSGDTYNESGSGSGFLISDDGYVVTNNHVVAGAGRITVHTETSETPFSGRIVGTSECADIAVIDIDTENSPYLTWADSAIRTGQAIFVAGYPLGDPEYTLIDGIVSKEKASGESDWASVDSVIEHSGDTLPGSSGGPIVTPEGLVVGVNYAGDDYGQAFGISAQTARSVVSDIIEGRPTLSIGVNGWAYESGTRSGVWVSSVEPDSAADRAGLNAGDLITEIGGIPVGEDLTLATYCDVLDSHKPDLPFDIRVWRSSENLYLEGVVNSTQTLEIASDAGGTQQIIPLSDGAGLADGNEYSAYELVWDDDMTVSFEVPDEWSDRESGQWTPFDAVDGVMVVAAPDIDSWDKYWDEPGVLVGVSSTLPGKGIDPDSFLSGLEVEDCQFGEQVDYDDGLYAGAYNIWVGCGGGEAMFIDWAAVDRSGDTLISAQFQLATEADIEAVGHVLETLYLTSDLDQ